MRRPQTPVLAFEPNKKWLASDTAARNGVCADRAAAIPAYVIDERL
jgi:hypothetical protein